jgi:predicted amidohydrolase YtcJ
MKMIRIYALFNLLPLVFISCQQEKENVDLIVYNAQIQTVDSTMQLFQAMAVREGRILDLGSSKYINKTYRSAATIDFKNRYVYPGFIDPHSHFTGYSFNLTYADLWNSVSMEEIIERLKEHDENNPNEKWILGRGWDQNHFEIKEMPDNSLLNEMFPNKPVYLVRVDGHAAIANNRALNRADINSRTIVEGGEVVIENGKPTGLLIDKAMDLVAQKIPKLTDEEKVVLLQKGERNLFSVGLTSVCDAGLSLESILFLDSLQKGSELDIRIYAMLNPTQENYNYFLSKGPYVTDRLSVRSIKLYADGALGSRGALLKQPYSDRPSTRGILVDDINLIKRACERAKKHGFQVNTHCIGDSAVRIMLDMYASYLEPGNDLRWRIEHAQIVDPVDFDKFGEHNIIPSIQTIHAVSDMRWAENRVGPERIKGAYAYRDLMNQTGWLPNGSDFPVENINPLYSYHAAFTRTEKDGFPAGGWHPEQALTREEALKGMTIWAAKANFEENNRGSIEKGKFADFVVFDNDLLTIEPEKIYDLKVHETWLEGKRVF